MTSKNAETTPSENEVRKLSPVSFFGLLLSMCLFNPALAQTPPSNGSAQSFAMLGSSTATNTGPSVIKGDLGVTPGTAVNGFPSGIVARGPILTADAQEKQTRADATSAYGDPAGQICNTTYGVPTAPDVLRTLMEVYL